MRLTSSPGHVRTPSVTLPQLSQKKLCLQQSPSREFIHFQRLINKSVLAIECYNIICTTCRSTESWIWRIGCNCVWCLKHRDACPATMKRKSRQINFVLKGKVQKYDETCHTFVRPPHPWPNPCKSVIIFIIINKFIIYILINKFTDFQ